MGTLRPWFRTLLQAWAILAAGFPAVADDPANTLGDLAALHAADGEKYDARPATAGATVLVFLSTECPIANAYTPTLNQLYDAFPAPGVKWVGVCVDPDQSDAEILDHAREYKLKLKVAVDRRGALARRLEATVTPEAFVIDPQGKIRYHGRIDDQFAARGVRNARPSGGDLKDALAAVLAGDEVAAPYIKPVGCPIPEVDADEAPADAS